MLIHAVDEFAQPGALLVQLLRVIRIIPDLGLFQLAFYFLETFRFARVVKDTPSGRQGDLAVRGFAGTGR